MVKPVGYKSPPDYTKWRKGQSGNPSGRKKGQRNLKTDLLAEVNETIQVSDGGRPRKLTKQQAITKTLVTLAIKGNTKAAALVLSQLAQIYGIVDEQPHEPPLDADEREIAAAIRERYPDQGQKP
jgi:hypothetical protein